MCNTDRIYVEQICMQCTGCISDMHMGIIEKKDLNPLKMCNLNLSHTFKKFKIDKVFEFVWFELNLFCIGKCAQLKLSEYFLY